MNPEIKYARNGDVSIAYQVLGSGPIDVVYVPPFASNLELQWQEPQQARYLQRLASFSRLVMFDKRGTGLSDRTGIATLEERMDDLRAVMDAVGLERAVVFGTSEGGAMSLLFAATYPQRVQALVLYGAYARIVSAPDYPEGLSPESKIVWKISGRVGGRGLWQVSWLRSGLLMPRSWSDRRDGKDSRQAPARPSRSFR